MKALLENDIRPSIYIYGLIPLHEDRNIAHVRWLKEISQVSDSGLPYCSLGQKGELIEHRSKFYPAFPFRGTLALVDCFAKFYYKFLDENEKKRRRDALEITEKLMIEMNALANKNGSSFYVALLGQTKHRGLPLDRYKHFFEFIFQCSLYVGSECVCWG